MQTGTQYNIITQEFDLLKDSKTVLLADIQKDICIFGHMERHCNFGHMERHYNFGHMERHYNFGHMERHSTFGHMERHFLIFKEMFLLIKKNISVQLFKYFFRQYSSN